ncbi:MAG: hypothetical protein ACFE7R_06985 [Candidatus Hodarchaeota archaeon]
MAIGQAYISQLQLEASPGGRHMTVFSPPGVSVEAAKYPVVLAGVLATPEPSEWLSIYDHSEAWRGLDREAIMSMRRHLYRFMMPVDAREMQPRNAVEILQTLALSVAPVALEVRADSLPPRNLKTTGSLLPCSPVVKTQSISLVTEPEVSKVSRRITDQDIPASEAIWKLIDYDYTLDQVARIMSVGLLGCHSSRRMIPLKNAYKAVIDSFINRVIMELTDQKVSQESRIYTSNLFGDSFTILSTPGVACVDYLHLEVAREGMKHGSSFEGISIPSNNAKTSVYADHARYSAYSSLLQEKNNSHVTIFQISRNARNQLLGPWLTRAGVRDALESTPIRLEDKTNALAVLNSVLRPELGVWADGTPLLARLGIELKESREVHPLVHT